MTAGCERHGNASAPTAIRFDDLSVTLNGVCILDRVRARVPAGRCTAVVGPNGAGKTTLLMALLGRIPYRGAIHFESGDRATGRPPRIGYVPQRLAIDHGMPLTVREFLVAGRQRLPVWFGCRSRHCDQAGRLLSAVGADHLMNHSLGNLSGGEIQRVLLALALQREPQFLILDEPAAGVDEQGEKMLCELLDHLRAQQHFTQLMVTHDLATVGAHAEHVICLNRRVTGEGTPGEVLSTRILTETYGLHMGTLDPRDLSMPPCPRHTVAAHDREPHHTETAHADP